MVKIAISSDASRNFLFNYVFSIYLLKTIIMAKQEKIYPKGYPRQTENFSDEQKFKYDVFEAIKKIALETTEKAFVDKGYIKKEDRAGEYGTGEYYGVGTALNHFNIRLSSRPQTNTYFEKIIYFGGKKSITDVNIGWDTKNKTIELAYKNSEFSAFRGYGSKSGAQLVNSRENFVIKSLPEFKKELKELFKSFAEKETAYITSTKIGIEDKTEKSINSMVETSMKKISLKNLMTSSDEDLSSAVDKYISEGKEKIINKTKMNSPEVVAANSKNKLLFDKKGLEDGVEPEIKEVTASGGNAAGSAFLGKKAFKPGGDLNLEEKRKFEKTPYAQGQKQRPSVKKTMKEGDSFWTTVELEPGSGYVPKGMNHNFESGNHSKNTNTNYPGKPKGKMNESVEPKAENPSVLKESLIKRKFSTINENEEKGINKKYIVTEQRSATEQTDRWKKLSLFEKNDTISASDNIIEDCGCSIENSVSRENGEEENKKDFMQRNSDAETGGNVDGRVVVMVLKPNSLSNAMLKVFEDDYLNENKAYILDLNSGNLVYNPNFKIVK